MLSIKLQTYGIFIVTDRVQSQHVQITDVPLYLHSRAGEPGKEAVYHYKTLADNATHLPLGFHRTLAWFKLPGKAKVRDNALVILAYHDVLALEVAMCDCWFPSHPVNNLF